MQLFSKGLFMRKNLGKDLKFMPLPVLMIGTYDENDRSISYRSIKSCYPEDDIRSKFDYPNVRVLGQLPLEKMEALYNKVSICLRIHISDGLSMSVLEAMAKGKKVIWNCRYPFAYPGSTTKEICNSLDLILKVIM